MIEETQVLIVGGGPVGLVLAMELGSRGVACVLINDRDDTSTHPQGNTHNSRTMEHYRRLGIVKDVRNTGLPKDHPTDVVYVTRFAGYELARLPMPSTDEKLAECHPGGDSPTPEPMHRANQVYVEPVLRRHAERHKTADIRFGWRLHRFDQHPAHVMAEVEELSTGRVATIQARFLVGCDGGRSLVRRSLGIRYEGKTGTENEFYDGRMMSAYVEVPGLYSASAMPRGWHYWTINRDSRATVIGLDGVDKFLVLAKPPSDMPIERVDPTPLVRGAIGVPLPVRVLSVKEWTAGQALVADKYSVGRAFLAGDSAHLFTPMGGFGMNTGIDDVANLGWKLAAVVQGWAPSALLDTYEIERRPIGFRNTRASRELGGAVTRLPIPECLEESGGIAERARARLGHQLSQFTEEFRSLGIQLGVRYDGSPIIVPDGTRAPPDSPITYVPTACPGGRAPHVWCADGSSLYDRFGPGFTLLRLGRRKRDGEAMQDAAVQMRLPLSVIDVDQSEARDLYACDFALIRPDHHVAWRGARVPDDPAALLARVIGRFSAP